VAAATKRAQVKQRPAPRAGAARAFRGLALVFLLSFVSLAGVMLTITALGGLGEWTAWQFVGVFGLLEAGSGLANIISPNIWRLPIAEAQTSHKTPVRFAASAILIPHWGGAARAVAGLVLLTGAAIDGGVAPATVLLVPLILWIAAAVVAASALVARLGVCRPDLDVVQLIIRHGGRDRELEPLSIGASALQFALSIATIPFVKAFPPDALYQPQLAPSPATVGIAIAIAVLLAMAAWLAWRGRVDWHAPREQQKEAEQYA
jgi:hypothetical protein